MLASSRRHLPCFVALIQVLSRASVVIIVLARCLEDVLLLFGRVLCTEGMSKLHLCIGEYLLLEVADLPLFVASHALDWPERAIVLVSRADSHVIEAAVRYPCQADLVDSSRHVNLRVACVLLTLVDHATLIDSLVGVECPAFLHRGSGLDRLLGANAVPVIARFLQLLRLL